ncbi:MAG: hypothetical protein ACOCUL_05210 [Bacteroidota bacterium]
MEKKTKQVTFETKCYENDWEFLLKAGRLQKMIEYCDYPFEKRVLYINNVSDLALVKKSADKCINKNIIDSYVVVEDYAKETLSHFNLTIDSFKGGYYYSIQELTGIYLCETEYLLHFSGDTIMRGKSPWINQALQKLEENPQFLLANPSWDKSFAEARAESFGEDPLFFHSFGFSDHCYLIKTERFRENIYHETHPDSERYPKYGGELFEKRVDSYLRNRDLYRLTSKTACFRHRNFPKKKWKRWFWINLGIKVE